MKSSRKPRPHDVLRERNFIFSGSSNVTKTGSCNSRMGKRDTGDHLGRKPLKVILRRTLRGWLLAKAFTSYSLDPRPCSGKCTMTHPFLFQEGKSTGFAIEPSSQEPCPAVGILCASPGASYDSPSGPGLQALHLQFLQEVMGELC